MRHCLEDSVRILPLKDNDMSEALRLKIGKQSLRGSAGLKSLGFINDERFDAALGELEILKLRSIFIILTTYSLKIVVFPSTLKCTIISSQLWRSVEQE